MRHDLLLCQLLTTATLGDFGRLTLTINSAHTMSNKISLKIEVTIPHGVTTIDESMVAVCQKMTSINIPSTVVEIKPWSFCDCTGLTIVDIPDSVATIGDSAFLNCKNLASIRLPKQFRSADEVARIGLKPEQII